MHFDVLISLSLRDWIFCLIAATLWGLSWVEWLKIVSNCGQSPSSALDGSGIEESYQGANCARVAAGAEAVDRADL
jgi:hypothetical protein